MHNGLIISLCFLPLAVIFVIMKVAVWLSGVYTEEKYVERESKVPHGPYVEEAYADIDEEDQWD